MYSWLVGEWSYEKSAWDKKCLFWTGEFGSGARSPSDERCESWIGKFANFEEAVSGKVEPVGTRSRFRLRVALVGSRRKGGMEFSRPARFSASDGGRYFWANSGKSPIHPRKSARTGKTLRTKNVGLGEPLRVPQVRRRSEPPAGRQSRKTDLEKPGAGRVFISPRVHAPSEKTRKNLRAIPSNPENRSDPNFFSRRS